MDALDRKILALLVEDGRRTYDDIGRRVSLSAPSVKRRIDRLREQGALERFTAVVDHGAMGWNTEALVELFYRPGTTLDEVAADPPGAPRGGRGLERHAAEFTAPPATTTSEPATRTVSPARCIRQRAPSCLTNR